jgi:hypothetical protein
MKLIPPDKKQCQTVKTLRNPWALGIEEREERCANKPSVIIKEKKAGADGKKGSMSLCKDCLRLAKKQFGDSVTVVKL